MNTQSNTVPESPIDSEAIASRTTSATQPLYWSVRRELWENRSVYMAPLLVAAVLLFGFVISMVRLPERRRAVLLLDPAQQQAAIEKPYDILAMLLILTAFIVGVFYCLDALHGERRDRSILFWKSLPVSDLTTVLAKAMIPLVVLPLIIFTIIVASQLIMLVLSTAIVSMNGLGDATAAQWSPFQQSLTLLYGLVTLALWQAPIFAWLLLLSGWARRATFLWAVLPLLAVSVVEKIALGSWHFASMLKYRLVGHAAEAYAVNTKTTVHSLAQLTPGHFLSTPGLWVGLAFAGAFLAIAVRLRRQGGAI
jgi:ABC-2 type transport system permease protein